MVHQWLKKAILLSFRLNEPHKIDGGPGGGAWWDKVPTKFAKWKAKDFKDAGFPRGAGRGGAPLGLYRARAWC